MDKNHKILCVEVGVGICFFRLMFKDLTSALNKFILEGLELG